MKETEKENQENTFEEALQKLERAVAVSYTHLTLPTICSV